MLQDTAALNEKLLQNILPKHVAEYFMKASYNNNVSLYLDQWLIIITSILAYIACSFGF